MINKLSREIHSINVKNGFYEGKKNIGEMIALCHSELSEALEADRKDKHANMGDFEELMSYDDEFFKSIFKQNIKDTFEDELADTMIRIMDMSAYLGIDLESHIRAKMRYNSLREYKHGKNY